MMMMQHACMRAGTCTTLNRRVVVEGTRWVHTTQGDLTQYVPNVAHVSPNTNTPKSTALQLRKPTEYYQQLFEDYSKKGVERFKALKQHAANIAPVRPTENPQFLISNKIFEEIVTDLSKYNLDEVNPYLMMLESRSHEDRVEAQRVISAVIKRAVSKDEMEKSFNYFRLLQLSYLPIDSDVYGLLREKIKDAFLELVNNKTSLPEIATLNEIDELINVIMNYLTETDKIPEAFSLLLSMKMAGIAPTAHTYTALLNACMKYEDTSDAMVAFDLMREDDIVVDYAYYDRLFQMCASSIYPLGTQTVLQEMCKRFMIPTAQRWLHKTTMYLTQLMKVSGMKQSERGRRGWVTGITIQTRLVFPPKTNYNRMLEPFSGEGGEEFLQTLSSGQYGLSKLNNPSLSIPFDSKEKDARTSVNTKEEERKEALKAAGVL